MFEELDLKVVEEKGNHPAEYTLPSYPYPCHGTQITQSSCGGTTLRWCC